MSSFTPAYTRTNGYEGRGIYACAPYDLGGATYDGISRRIWPKWGGWPIIDRSFALKLPCTGVDWSTLTALHELFFMENFWRPATENGAIEDQDIANEVYDSSVNCGVHRAVGWMQIALNASNERGNLWANVSIDDHVGPATIGAIARCCLWPQRRWLVLQVMETLQRHHYLSLCLADSTQEANLLGWYRLRLQWASQCPPAS